MTKSPRDRSARMQLLLAIGVVCLAGLGACEDRDEALTVFAAASLRAPLEEAAAEFAARHPEIDLQLNLAGSSTLALQILQGAPADLFVSADEPWIRRIEDEGRAAAPPSPWVSNRLCLAVRAGNPRGVEGLADWTRPDLQVGLCGPEVPAGRYARQLFERAGMTPRSVSDEPDVHALATKVALGEIDAAILYRTDLPVHGLQEVPVDVDTDVGIRYWLAPIGARDDGVDDDVRAFLDFLDSADGRSLLGRHGFVVE